MTHSKIFCTTLLCFIRPIRAIDTIAMAKPYRVIMWGPNRSDASPTTAPRMTGIVVARKIRLVPMERRPNISWIYIGKTASNAVMTVICMKMPKHAVKIRVDLNSFFVTSNLPEKTNFAFSGLFHGFQSLLWVVKISGSCSLASALIGLVRFFFSWGWFCHRRYLPLKRTTHVTLPDVLLKGLGQLHLTVESTFRYFSAVFRLTIVIRIRKTTIMMPRYMRKTGMYPALLYTRPPRKGRKYDSSV